MPDALRLIGRTPAVRLATPDGHAELWAKIECKNLGGSVKDRIALAMIEDARASGDLEPGQPVVEATSGNTGIGLAIVCGCYGHPLTLVLPESASPERVAIAKALGAEVVVTPAEGGMCGAIAEAIRLESEGAYRTSQFENPSNPAAHERTTGPEIAEHLGGSAPDAFVAGVGTGGTIMGTALYLRSLSKAMRVLAVEPAASPVLSGGAPGPHRIEGIGAGFAPPLLDLAVLDDIETVDDLDAWRMSRTLAREQGLFVGVSAGAAVVAAMREAARLGSGKTVFTLLPDGGERYVSLEPYFEL